MLSGQGSHGAGRKLLTDLRKHGSGTAEREPDLPRLQEIGMNRVIEVGSQSTVQVLRRMCNAVAADGGPPLGRSDLGRRR